MSADLRFPRPDLAHEMAQSLSGRHKWNSDADGLFLAAPRRTGKSTFLRQDLKPALEAAGVEVIYFDLWANLDADPTELIYAAVRQALLANAGVVARMSERVGLQKLTLGAGAAALEFDVGKLGHAAGSSLTDGLRLLIESVGRVALIIDEAQHLLVSKRGDDVSRELKAARDSINAPGDTKLMLIMSGSDRDKLGRLTNSKSAAFYGSRVKPMPLLDADYVDWMCGLLAASAPRLGTIRNATLLDAFRALGNRPIEMDAAISSALNPRLNVGMSFEEAVTAHAVAIVEAERARFRDQYLALSGLQRAVLKHMLDSGDSFAPFGAVAHEVYEAELGRSVTSPAVQKALNAMREHRPPIVWKSNWGEYAVEDLGMATWYQMERDAGRWPPT